MKIIDKYYKESEYLLYNYRMLEISIKNMQQEIEYLKKEDGIRGISYGGITTSPSFKISSSTEDIVLSVNEQIDYLDYSIRRIKTRLDSIDKALEGLTKAERSMIKKRYIIGKQWHVVAYEVSYSERWCKQLRTEAIKKTSYRNIWRCSNRIITALLFPFFGKSCYII